MTHPDLPTVTHRELTALIAAHRRRGTHWIYALQRGPDGPVKIGSTKNNPRERLRTLQTGNPELLRGIALWRGTPADERGFQEAFADVHIRGEWFQPAEELLETLRWMDSAACEWHPEDECLAGLPGTCEACGVEFS